GLTEIVQASHVFFLVPGGEPGFLGGRPRRRFGDGSCGVSGGVFFSDASVSGRGARRGKVRAISSRIRALCNSSFSSASSCCSRRICSSKGEPLRGLRPGFWGSALATYAARYCVRS